MRILHVIPGLENPANGIAVAAKLIAESQRKAGHEVRLVEARQFETANLFFDEKMPCDEAWIHSMWTPRIWRACWKVLKLRAAIGTPRLVRMTHANLDPIRLRYHGWKKRLVTPLERWLFARTDRVVTTGVWETEWCRQWGVRGEIQEMDLGQFFNCQTKEKDGAPSASSLHLLYLGRRHPLKGVDWLERAVREINAEYAPEGAPRVELRIESELFGRDKEDAWRWCDVFCLPTVSENFGLVIAEALARGKPVITTDGAPAWESFATSSDCASAKLVYLKGFRAGTAESRTRQLKEALKTWL